MKNYFLSIVCFTAICLLSACSGDTKITVKGADGTIYESYQECCAVNDFEAAHQYLNKMKNEIDAYSQKYAEKIARYATDEYEKSESMKEAYNEAYNDVLQKEALFLIADGSEDAVNRLVFLMKEDEGKKLDASQFLELALTQNNVNLATKMLALDNSLANEEMVLQAIANNSDEIVDIMLRNNPLLIKVPKCAQYYRYRDEQLYEKLTQLAGKAIEDQMKESLKELMSQANFPVLSKGVHSEDISVEGPECNNRISRFNQDCITLIQQAIHYRNKSIAESAFRLMKPNIVVHGWTDAEKIKIKIGGRQYYVQYIDSDINEAKRIIKDAERNGAFK